MRPNVYKKFTGSVFYVQNSWEIFPFKPIVIVGGGRSDRALLIGSNLRRRSFFSSSSHDHVTTTTTSSPTTQHAQDGGVDDDAGDRKSPVVSSQNESGHDRGGLRMSIDHGLPQLTVPLPSRHELCRFTLRPVTQTVSDVISQLQKEDKGIDRVIFSSLDGVRIASSTSVESLLMKDFTLAINDVSYTVTVPFRHRITSEELREMGDVRQLVNRLYAALNIDEHQLEKERQILARIEDIKSKLIPFEQKRNSLVALAEKRTSTATYALLLLMGFQFGALARLTWWEYSWDIMEPVTYFVTYGTAVMAYAYYVITRQDFVLPEVRDRYFLLTFYKRAQKVGLNVQEYNELKERLSILDGDLRRLKDPLALNLPPEKLEYDPRCHDALSKAQHSIRSILNFSRRK